jgi:Flp pilus assembly pilin Flp
MSLFVKRSSCNIEEERASPMVKLYNGTMQIWRDVRGQDMIEYALLAAAIAVTVAGFLPTTLMPAISTIFSKIVSSYNAS